MYGVNIGASIDALSLRSAACGTQMSRQMTTSVKEEETYQCNQFVSLAKIIGSRFVARPENAIAGRIDDPGVSKLGFGKEPPFLCNDHDDAMRHTKVLHHHQLAFLRHRTHKHKVVSEHQIRGVAHNASQPSCRVGSESGGAFEVLTVLEHVKFSSYMKGS